MSPKDPTEKTAVTCSQICTVPLIGQSSRLRHVAETDDDRLVVLETGANIEVPKVTAGPITLGQALELAEHVLAGSPRHITHSRTPLVLAATLLAMAAQLTKPHAS